jgi:serine protease Do
MKKYIIGLVALLMMNLSVNAQEVVIIKKNSNDSSEKPLLVLDGIVSSKNINDIAPDQIESVNVLKGEMAKKKYGADGAKGVIEITSKKKNKGYATTLDTNINLSIIIDGDKITINGKPADKNDPRLKMMGKSRIITSGKNNGKGKSVIIEDITTSNDPMEEEGSDDILDMMQTPPPPPNQAFLGVITEAVEKGAKINSVSDESPANKAGLKEDDVITKVNDKKIDGPKALYEAVGTYKPEDKITITYQRDGKELKATATLEKNKSTNVTGNFNFAMPNGQLPNNLRRGFRIAPDQNFSFEMPQLKELDGIITNRNNKKPKLGISIEDTESGEGVKIKNVIAGSPAEKAGLKTNDIITQFDENKVTDVNDLKWGYLQEGQVLKFTIQRNGEKKKIEVKIPKKLKSADL